jgi:Protein of unknown function, DUF481
MKRAIVVAITTLFLCSNAFSQNQQQSAKIKVFLDCTRQWLCDYDYVRTEMKMVEFVRDRLLADVHVLVNTQFSSGGGEQNEVSFVGLSNFKNLNDTLVYFNDPTFTDDDKRRKLVQYMKLGLTRFIAKTSAAKDLQISYAVGKEDEKKETAAKKKDPWNYWIFTIGASGFFNGNQNFKSANINAYVNADKETEKLRSNLSINYSKNFREFNTSPTEKVKVDNDEEQVSYFLARKLTKHISVGGFAEFNKSVFNNIDTRITLRPRVEYSFLPYPKFNSERIVLQYAVGPEYSNYGDTSIYFVMQEWQIKQSINLIASFTKNWGSINIGTFWSNYFDDFQKNSLTFSGGISWRVFKGFQFGVGGNYSINRDQIFLPKSGASRDDVLTQRRAIASSYDYFLGVGFSYRFGSIFNTAVHQTFKGLNYSLNF